MRFARIAKSATNYTRRGGRTLERGRKQWSHRCSAKASNGCGREQAQGRNQPDEEDGKNRRPCTAAGIAKDGVDRPPGPTLHEAWNRGVRNGRLTFWAQKRQGPGARRLLRFAGPASAREARRECDGGDCHPYPRAFVSGSGHFEPTSHIVSQNTLFADVHSDDPVRSSFTTRVSTGSPAAEYAAAGGGNAFAGFSGSPHRLPR